MANDILSSPEPTRATTASSAAPSAAQPTGTTGATGATGPVGPPCPSFGCKGFMRSLAITSNVPQSRCTVCGMEAVEYVFHPLVREIQRAQLALPDDATCVFHPNKKAVHTCAGTGNFICALCSVPLRDSIYSVQFLDSPPGKAVIGGNFDRYLPRPDRLVATLLTLCVIPPINFMMWMTAVIWFPYGIFQWFVARRQFKTDALYRAQVHPAWLWSLLILFVTIGGGAMLFFGWATLHMMISGIH